MVVLSLVSLCERVMECNSRPVVAETSKVCLRSLLFFDRDRDKFDLNLNQKLASFHSGLVHLPDCPQV